MIRYADMETAAMKEMFTHSSLETDTDIMQAQTSCRVTWGSTKIGQKVEGMRENCRRREHVWKHLWFLWGGMLEAQQADLGLASLSNFDGL